MKVVDTYSNVEIKKRTKAILICFFFPFLSTTTGTFHYFTNSQLILSLLFFSLIFNIHIHANVFAAASACTNKLPTAPSIRFNTLIE